MASRILVADDSLTIQKVIGITLANSGYEIVECVNEDELFKKIQSNQFDLILLDFNLSDTRSGYDLSKQIYNAMPGVAIIVMLGTFDTIDEAQFSSCGIADKIVKPFESSKFIKKCRDLLEGVRPAPVALSETKAETIEPIGPSDDLDLWTVEAPNMAHKEDPIESLSTYTTESKSLDPLSSEIEGWGFQASNSIEDRFQKSFPPVIEELGENEIIERLQASSNFEQDNTNSFELEDLDETDPAYEMPEDLNRNLLTEINEEISAEAFWAVDEIVPVKAEEYSDISSTNLEEVTTDLTETVQNFRESEAKPVVAASKVVTNDDADTIIHMDQDELVEKLKISLRPMIEEMVREFCRQQAEKVAWEVIPDLAENLIRKELKEISDSVQH